MRATAFLSPFCTCVCMCNRKVISLFNLYFIKDKSNITTITVVIIITLRSRKCKYWIYLFIYTNTKHTEGPEIECVTSRYKYQFFEYLSWSYAYLSCERIRFRCKQCKAKSFEMFVKRRNFCFNIVKIIALNIFFSCNFYNDFFFLKTKRNQS